MDIFRNTCLSRKTFTTSEMIHHTYGPPTHKHCNNHKVRNNDPTLISFLLNHAMIRHLPTILLLSQWTVSVVYGVASSSELAIGVWPRCLHLFVAHSQIVLFHSLSLNGHTHSVTSSRWMRRVTAGIYGCLFVPSVCFLSGQIFTLNFRVNWCHIPPPFSALTLCVWNCKEKCGILLPTDPTLNQLIIRLPSLWETSVDVSRPFHSHWTPWGDFIFIFAVLVSSIRLSGGANRFLCR